MLNERTDPENVQNSNQEETDWTNPASLSEYLAIIDTLPLDKLVSPGIGIFADIAAFVSSESVYINSLDSLGGDKTLNQVMGATSLNIVNVVGGSLGNLGPLNPVVGAVETHLMSGQNAIMGDGYQPVPNIVRNILIQANQR